MNPRTEATILFASAKAANLPVAGIPAAARAIATALELRPEARLTVAVPGGWFPDATTRAEIARLAPSAQWEATGLDASDTPLVLDGAALQRPPGELKYIAPERWPDHGDIPALRRAAKAIIRATGKSGDGIVSRHINRPISRAMTGVMLRHAWPRPWHATMIAAAIGLAMFAALLWGGEPGLLVGAALFQLASIVDGVDGEMARATRRSSDAGAMMDSLTDAATNLGFIGGVSFNLYVSRAETAGLAGAAGFIILATGTALLAWQSRCDGGAFTFDALKSRIGARPSRVRQWLVYMTMRDFYAFAAFVAIFAGFAQILMFAFATVAAGWFAVLCTMLVSTRILAR